MLRYPLAALSAALITFGLLFTMHQLIVGNRMVIEEKAKRFQMDFVRVKREETVERRERKKPQKLERPDAPPPAAAPQQSGPAEMAIDIPIVGADLSLGDGPGLGTGSDSDVVPLVRVNPQYPAKAASRGIEGWVHLRFTVTARGTTDDILVLDSNPTGYFESAARQAVKRYKYKPKVDNGQAVDRPGVEVVLSFELEK
jgi:protein TonB